MSNLTPEAFLEAMIETGDPAIVQLANTTIALLVNAKAEGMRLLTEFRLPTDDPAASRFIEVEIVSPPRFKLDDLMVAMKGYPLRIESAVIARKTFVFAYIEKYIVFEVRAHSTWPILILRFT